METEITEESLKSKKAQEIKDIAKELKIGQFSQLSKDQIIEKILEKVSLKDIKTEEEIIENKPETSKLIRPVPVTSLTRTQRLWAEYLLKRRLTVERFLQKNPYHSSKRILEELRIYGY